MPPNKLKLASKVKKLSTSLKIDQIATGVNADINGKSLPLETLEAVSKKNATMEKAITKSKANLRNLRPRTAVDNRDEEPEEPKKESKLDKSGKKRKLKNVVDLEMMKEELKQLEDPPNTIEEKRLCENRLGYEFFDVPAEELAKKLLGKILVRKLDNGTLLKGKIVETESYLGGEDRASASYQYRVSAANIATYMPPGTIYIYLTYGMYHCLSISSKGEGSVALIRALSPIEGADLMAEFRNAKLKNTKTYKLHELSNGPSKFCIAFGLTRDHNKYSVCDWRGMWVEDNPENENIQIVSCPRIGIDGSGPEWALKPMRYYILGEKSVSKSNKNAEAAFAEQG
ncbi:DNA-3-methyladenine glycosylase-like [Athalia rosae]|uniref:DNA-3-methyladenine glycosylase-like n=1 Tax=Athalia rosae TaxID=37344 RepID=UPI002034059F|nr:DNA-3-methyladenine glycosylase-like [Athalia rosae]